MNKTTKNKIVPKLRFPEFEKNGDWKVELLGELVDIKGRIGYRGYTTADIVEKGKGAITLSPSNFDEQGNLKFNKCTYISWDKYEESPEIMLEEGQTVLVKTASVGKSAYVEKLPEKATINPQIVVLKPEKIHPKFLAYSISHNYVQTQIRSSVGAGAIPNMSQESISQFKILLPNENTSIEQQKIADCLSSLDELIAAEGERLATLKAHKKGLMQNLFPQEKETVPRLRFPEFRGSSEWEKDVLGGENVATFVSEKVGLREVQLETYVSTENLLSDYCGKMIATRLPASGTFTVFNRKDILLSNIRPYLKKGWFANTDGTASNDVIVIRAGSKIDATFLSFLLMNDYFINYVMKSAEGVKMPRGDKDVIKEYSITFPKVKEQQKIANCLSSLDNLITAQNEKLDALRLHKKGLLQQLFPIVNKINA